MASAEYEPAAYDPFSQWVMANRLQYYAQLRKNAPALYMAKLKLALFPAGILNPGKVLPA